MSLIQFKNVGLRYNTGPEILRDLDLTVKSGSFHFLTGASGTGKTTLLKLLYLGQIPTRGLINMFDQDILSLDRTQMAQLRRQIGIVFQDFKLLNHLTAYDNVALPLRIMGVSEDNIKKTVTELLNWVGLGDKMDCRPLTLSGGEQQRIAITRAVINRPRLLLADEPTGNVDRKIGLKLLTLFEELNKLGTTIIIATHDEKLIQRFGHPQLHLQNGKIIKRAALKKEES